MDRIAGMEAFVAVVEAGGFQAAARQLGVSRALVSKRLSALERTLGVQLLHRTTRRLSVTGPGSAFYESCQRILGEFRDAAGELTQLQLQPRGTLKINAPMSFGQLQLAPALIEFQRLHPGIAIQLTLTDRFVDVIEEGYDLVHADRRVARLLADRPPPLLGPARAVCRPGLSGPGRNPGPRRGARRPPPAALWLARHRRPLAPDRTRRQRRWSTCRRRCASTMATC